MALSLHHEVVGVLRQCRQKFSGGTPGLTKRTLASVAIGLALPLTLVGSAAADIGDDVRDSITVPSGAEIRDQIDISPGFVGDGDDGDDGDEASFDAPSSGDFSGIDDAVREEFSGIGGAVRDRVLSED